MSFMQSSNRNLAIEYPICDGAGSHNNVHRKNREMIYSVEIHTEHGNG